MTFDRGWVLAIAWLPLAWAAWEWTRTRRRLALTLKCLALVAILLALAEPKLRIQETKVALAVLVDTSASVSQTDLEKASQLTRAMRGAQGRHWMRVSPFARSTRELDRGEAQQGSLRPTPGEAGRATDLEGAVRDAIAVLPGGLVPRLALISDGKENRGSIARAAWQAQQLGIPIDTFPVPGRSRPALRLESASFPSLAFTGEQFPIDLAVSAPRAASAQIERDRTAAAQAERDHAAAERDRQAAALAANRPATDQAPQKISLNGIWREDSNGVTSIHLIEQRGNNFNVIYSTPGKGVVAKGQGVISGRNVAVRYYGMGNVAADCKLTLSANGSVLDGYCRYSTGQSGRQIMHR